MFNKTLLGVFALVAVLVFIQPATADTTVTYGNAAGGNGVYVGTGIPDGAFTTVTTLDDGDGIALSLRKRTRYLAPTLPQTNNLYTCVAGEQCSFDFSIATIGDFDLADYSFSLAIIDVTKGTSLSLDPLLIPDNAYWQGLSKTYTKDLANQTGAQNSEWLGFDFLKLPLNWAETDTVLIQLFGTKAGNTTGVQIGINSAEVPASVPEPASIVLLVSVLGLCRLGQRRFSSRLR